MSKFLSKIVSFEKSEVQFGLGNGLKLVGCIDGYSSEIRDRLALHGLSQKVGDSCAGLSKSGDFRGAFAVMQAVLDSLSNGVWSSRTGGLSDLIEALMSVQNIEEDEAREIVDSMDEETVKAVANHPAIKAEVKKQQAERAAEAAKATADTAPDLSELLKRK